MFKKIGIKKTSKGEKILNIFLTKIEFLIIYSSKFYSYLFIIILIYAAIFIILAEKKSIFCVVNVE